MWINAELFNIKARGTFTHISHCVEGLVNLTKLN